MESGSSELDSVSKWKLARSVIEHENTLKSHRVTWLLATQLLLFTAFTTIFVKFAENNNSLSAARFFAPLSLICLIGMFTSILAWSNIRAAQKMVKRIQEWWLQHYCPPRNSEQEWLESVTFGRQEDRFLPINGIFTKNLYVFLDETKLPGAIAVAWLILLVFTSIGFISAKFDLERNCVALAALCLVLIFLLSLKYTFEPFLRTENPDARNALIHLRAM